MITMIMTGDCLDSGELQHKCLNSLRLDFTLDRSFIVCGKNDEAQFGVLQVMSDGSVTSMTRFSQGWYILLAHFSFYTT